MREHGEQTDRHEKTRNFFEENNFFKLNYYSDISRRRQIILLVLRILATMGIITFFIMWMFTDRNYMKWFFTGLAIMCFVIPELTAELLVRDFPNLGIRNISRRIRLALTPFIYGIAYAVSPILFHSFHKLFADGNRSSGGNVSSLQIGLWHILFEPPLCGPFIIRVALAIIFPVLLLATSATICYLALSESWRRRLAAVALFVALEASAALAAGNSPG